MGVGMEQDKLREGSNITEDFGCIGIRPEACVTCMYANGEPPWEDSPLKSYCIAYPRSGGVQKPSSVYYGGGECEFYMEQP